MYKKFKLKHLKDPEKSTFRAILQRELLKYFRLNLNEERRSLWDNYLKDYNTTLAEILGMVVKTLKLTTADEWYILSINGERYIKKERLLTMAKLVDQGNLSIKGTHLISDGFNYIENNIDKIVRKYYGV